MRSTLLAALFAFTILLVGCSKEPTSTTNPNTPPPENSKSDQQVDKKGGRIPKAP